MHFELWIVCFQYFCSPGRCWFCWCSAPSCPLLLMCLHGAHSLPLFLTCLPIQHCGALPRPPPPSPLTLLFLCFLFFSVFPSPCYFPHYSQKGFCFVSHFRFWELPSIRTFSGFSQRKGAPLSEFIATRLFPCALPSTLVHSHVLRAFLLSIPLASSWLCCSPVSLPTLQQEAQFLHLYGCDS